MARGSTVLIRTGVANLASVLAGLRRAGADAVLSDDPERIAVADRVVLPGVGSFGAAMAQLRLRGVAEALAGRIREERPTLAICLGLQLLGAESDESPGVGGLALFAARATRLGPAVRVPQLGWNRVQPDGECRQVQAGYAYFANSYRLTSCPAGWHAAWAEHGGRFVAALERGPVLACQFHPELSGDWGCALLRRWLGAGRLEESPC